MKADTSDTFDTRRNRALVLIADIHGAQTRKGTNVPDWYHLARVSRVLDSVLLESHEGAQEAREAIILAAICHDALEDTDIRSRELETYVGSRALSYVEAMTNKEGGGIHEPYVSQVVKAPEEVRLIKLADLYDNYTNVLFVLPTVRTEWAESFFMPIVEPMTKALLQMEFHTYPATALFLKGMVRISSQLLREEIVRYNGEKHVRLN